MRRLSLLLLGLALASLGTRPFTDAAPGAAALPLDALLLGAVGGLLFALNASGWLAPPALRRPRGLPQWGWTLLLTGLAVTLGGGFGLALGLAGVGDQAAALAWLLGMALQLAGAWWPGAASEYALPATRWGRDAAGRIVPLAAGADQAGAPRRQRPAPELGLRGGALWLLGVLALAILLRFWNLEQLPPGCIDAECTTALQLLPADDPGGPNSPGDAPVPGTSEVSGTSPAAGIGGGLALDLRLAALLAQATGSGLLGLRLASAFFGVLAVLFTALALRRLVAPLPALLGAALLAISPWHLWAGRSSDPALAATALAALALWLGLAALARPHARWWLPWGLAAGLFGAQAPGLWPGAALWALVVAGLGLAGAWQQRGRVGAADHWRWPLCGLLAAAGAALPVYPVAAALQTGVLAMGNAADAVAANVLTLAGALLQGGATTVTGAAQSGLLDGLSAALALVGCATLLRYGRQGAAGLLLAGVAALLGAATLLDLTTVPPATALLPALPLLVAAAAVAADRLLAALVAAWGPPLVRASTLLAGAALLLLLPAARDAATLLWQLDAVRGGGAGQVETDMARYIGAQLRAQDAAPAETNVTFVAPPSAIAHPSLRLLGGAAVAENRVQPLLLGHTLPFAQTPTGDVIYLLPLLDNQVLALLRELYPTGEATTELNAEGTAALFNRYTVRQADLLAAQSLEMLLAPADATAPTAWDAPLAVPALDFAWAAPPRALPFTAQWRGSLVVPDSGDYTLAVASSGPESIFTLKIDDILLLDTSLNLREQQMPLGRGIHRLDIYYRSGQKPGDLRVTWQATGGSAQTLAAPLLHSPTLADQGLLGDYYGSATIEGPVIATHKDPIIGLDPGLPRPYSVIWHGLLAAPRAGEYLIGVDAPGAAQVAVNGGILADNRMFSAPLPGDATTSTYNDGLIYLPAGWYRIEVRYLPEDTLAAPAATANGAATSAAAAPDRIRLLWQPPGSDPSELASRFLLPAYGQVGPLDVPLPPAPPLSDPQLGDDRFALSRTTTTWQPLYRQPASGLPALALEQLWQAGGVCGDAPGQLNAPHGAAWAADGSYLYVADTGNRRVAVYDAAGTPLAPITSDQWQEPVDVALALDGGLLVLDALAQQVFHVAVSASGGIGNGVTGAGAVTALPLQASFYRPRGLGVDAATGSIVVADTGGGRVIVLGPDGALVAEYGGQGSLLARGQPVDALPAGAALWAISAEDGRLWNLTVDGSLTAVLPTGTVDGPHLARLRDGRLLATDPGRATFLLFSAAGEPLAQFGYTSPLQNPTGIATAPGAEGEVITVVDTRACTVWTWRMGG